VSVLVLLVYLQLFDNDKIREKFLYILKLFIHDICILNLFGAYSTIKEGTWLGELLSLGDVPMRY
jgi:hypothetical protein